MASLSRRTHTRTFKDQRPSSGPITPRTAEFLLSRLSDPAKINSKKILYEVNIYDQRPEPAYGAGAIVDFAAGVADAPRQVASGNTFEITAKGSQLIVVLNGIQTVTDVPEQPVRAGTVRPSVR